MGVCVSLCQVFGGTFFVFLRNYWNPNKLAIHIDTNLYFLLLIGRNRSIHIYIKLPPNYHHKYSPYCRYETKKSNGV